MAEPDDKKSPQETKDRAIQCIEQAIMVIDNNDFDYLAGNLDIWDEGIHLHMAPDIPFNESFDEFVCDATEEQKASLKPKLIEWLEDCLVLAKEDQNTSQEDISLGDIVDAASKLNLNIKNVTFSEIEICRSCQSILFTNIEAYESYNGVDALCLECAVACTDCGKYGTDSEMTSTRDYCVCPDCLSSE